MVKALQFVQGRDTSDSRQGLEPEAPLRSALFGPEQLEQHAVLLATEHQVNLDRRAGRELLLDRLRENQQLIRRAYRVAATAVKARKPVAPAVDWLLDNYHIIEEHILLAKKHLPRGYSRELPRLTEGRLKDHPRVYDLAQELVTHTDARIDADNLSHYVRAYQRSSPLRIGELWATPIMLRMALIENLRRISQRIVYRRHERDAAIRWAERFHEADARDTGSVITTLAELVREQRKSLSNPFIVELTMQLEGRHAIGLVQSWLEQELARTGQSLEYAHQAERQDQAADQVSIGNTISSLRLLTQTDWSQFVEAHSVVDAVLRNDPAGVYGQMDFHTRDRYRHVIERLAMRTQKEELAIAQLAVDMAGRHDSADEDDPTQDGSRSHVGYFLIGPGKRSFEARVNYTAPLSTRVGRLLRRAAPVIYLFVIILSGIALSLGIVLNFAPNMGLRWGGVIFTALLVLLVATKPILSIINWLATRLVPPRGLPRMDFELGIPDEHRTLVAIPTMITSSKVVDDLVSHLEIRYLANRDANLLFALVSDYADADERQLPTDQAVLDHAIASIEKLNARHASADRPVFYLIHRSRQWNQGEGKWMGRERKRGKLIDLNHMILGHAADGATLYVGDRAMLESVKYVITLDSDTQLPPQAAWRMVGTMAHPLNRPVVDAQSRCVHKGYGVLQPRVANSRVGASASWYARLYSGQVGFDPYTREISEVYHDIYSHTPFIGKGIYDVQAFEAAVGQRFPDNAILSHDLIEGLHARCGFINDVELIEDHPSRYLTDARRRHRWVRGDWQLLPWLMPRVRDCHQNRISNPLGFLAHWMMLDNLRRSIWPAGVLALLALSWLVLPGAPAVWSVVVLGIILLPWVLQFLTGLILKPARVTWRYHLRYVAHNHLQSLVPDLIQLLLLPYEAWFHLDAMARVFWRKLISRRKLLEWQTASDAERSHCDSLRASLRAMWVNPAVALLLGGLTYWLHPSSLPVALVWVAAWVAGPVIVWRISQPMGHKAKALTDPQVAMLRRVARQTWHYFEVFVNAEHQWLVPDNVQLGENAKVADRTSPTNLGMALLSTLAARDFGYISHRQLLTRLDAMLESMSRLERFRGHFFNWYRTTDGVTLPPRYVSSVDSGNLVGALITLRQGLLELVDRPAFSAECLDGLQDTAASLRSAAQALSQSDRRQESASAVEGVMQFCVQVQRITRPRVGVCQMAASLEQWHLCVEKHLPRGPLPQELAQWTNAMRRQVDDFRQDIKALVPWACARLPFLEKSEEASIFALRLELDGPVTLRQIVRHGQRWQETLQALQGRLVGAEADIKTLANLIEQARKNAQQRIEQINALAQMCDELGDFDLSFLFDRQKKLLSIGYDVTNHRRDEGAYDLLASEARLCSYLGIAQGQLPHEHWFVMGRQQAPSDSSMPTLLSWSGSMFEYLMPQLIMPTYEDTLISETCKSAVDAQIRHGRQLGIPWGVSESCYNLVDSHFNYQYRAFGVPSLGLKRGLAEDTVVAPYAAVMALMVRPRAAAANIHRMINKQWLGPYGLVEAVDYTRQRVPTNEPFAVINVNMAHHNGMSMLSLASELLGQPMQRRFLADAQMRSVVTLLEERVPAELAESPTEVQSELLDSDRRHQEVRESPMRIFQTVRSSLPDVHLLGNSRYNVMITSAGTGASTWNDLAINRWQEDAARNDMGIFCYFKDVASGRLWSATHQPVGQEPKAYQAIFSQAMAEFRRVDDQIETYTRVAVSPEDDIEIRRIVLTNLSSEAREIEATSYMEVVLLAAGAHVAHPAFNNLFVQTQLLEHQGAILATRRRRSNEETPPWMFHMLVGHDSEGGRLNAKASFETDRSLFMGRGRRVSRPAAMDETGPLTNSQGAVLDPVAAVRRRVIIPAHASVILDMISGAAPTREQVHALVDKYQDHRLAERVFSLAWTHSQVLLQHLHAMEPDAQMYGKLASSIIHAGGRHRASPSRIARNMKGQSSLWSYGISGDLPIMLVQMTDRAGMDLVLQCLRAHSYYRQKGLLVDLVIMVDAVSSYRQPLRDEILSLISSGPASAMLDQRGGIFLRTAEQIPEDDQLLLQAMARVYMSDRGGSFEEQVERRPAHEPQVPLFKPAREASIVLASTLPAERDLVFHNGLGGFTPDGKEYIITLHPGQRPPMPWSNVIANARFGTVVTESGGAYSWFQNAHEYRLTPWYNDPVSDVTGEAFYIRDEETGVFWSPTPGPVQAQASHVVRHGLGYTIFEHTCRQIQSEMHVFVPEDMPAKIVTIKLTNQGQRTRRLSVTGYFEWVLGEHRHKNAMHTITRRDMQSGAIFAQNRFNGEFANCIAFAQCNDPKCTITGDRLEFIGRTGSLQRPRAMTRRHLSSRVGAGLDPCAAFQSMLELAPGQSIQVVFILGAANNEDEARHILRRLSSDSSIRQALEAVWSGWPRRLNAIYVETPDRALNILSNYWLLYQCLSCRIWGRSGFYQSGGAYGFRDQLQDAMAVLHTMPDLLRSQLLINASRQFVEGDVQHWWHPPLGRGVRTLFSDDYLWLPLATARYVLATGDRGVLDEMIPYLTGRAVGEHEESYYDRPHISDELGSLFDHCRRAIERSLARTGPHGLPLIGCGDWNDGMNRVGLEGKGESVWLGFFLHHVMDQFIKLCEMRGEDELVLRYRQQMERITDVLESQAWDGQWYRRAYFDDGRPLGSKDSPECKIDSLPQSWSVISGATDPERAVIAMDQVDEHLVRRDADLIQLFNPPFDDAPWDPGYIKGYVPGVRENGGQYTHAAIWAVIAFAQMRDVKRAWELAKMINPIHHGDTPEKVELYKVEPYVVAADVYTNPAHLGRGGWTWYTGSAGWMYRLMIEHLLGLQRHVDHLTVNPVVPQEWQSLRMYYRHYQSHYHIVINIAGPQTWQVRSVTIDGQLQPDERIPLINDGREHQVVMEVG